MIDDGVDRGIMLAIINADPGRQFEFVQARWANDGNFISQGDRTDSIVGRPDAADDFQYPAKPARRRVQGYPLLPQPEEESMYFCREYQTYKGSLSKI